MRSRFPGALMICALLLAACGGGSSGSVTPSAGGGGAPGPGTAGSMSVAMTGFAVLGVSASVPLTLTIKDASGNALSGALASPITLTSSDTTGVVTVSPSSITNASTPVNLVYSGGKLSGAVTISGTESGGTLSVTPLSFLPNGDHPLAGGTSASYAQTVTTTPVFPAGAPAVSNSSYIETLTANATFNGMSNLIDDKVTQQTGTGTSASTSTNDYYLQLSPTTVGTNVLEVGNAENYQSLYGTDIGNYVYSSPSLTLDELPHKSGNTWSSMYGYRGQIAFSSNGHSIRVRATRMAHIRQTMLLARARRSSLKTRMDLFKSPTQPGQSR